MRVDRRRPIRDAIEPDMAFHAARVGGEQLAAFARQRPAVALVEHPVHLHLGDHHQRRLAGDLDRAFVPAVPRPAQRRLGVGLLRVLDEPQVERIRPRGRRLASLGGDRDRDLRGEARPPLAALFLRRGGQLLVVGELAVAVGVEPQLVVVRGTSALLQANGHCRRVGRAEGEAAGGPLVAERERHRRTLRAPTRSPLVAGGGGRERGDQRCRWRDSGGLLRTEEGRGEGNQHRGDPRRWAASTPCVLPNRGIGG